MKHSIYYLFCGAIFTYLIFSCSTSKKVKEKNVSLSDLDFNIKERWEFDYCGYLGVRDSLVNFFDTANYLIGNESIKIRAILGKPVYRGIRENNKGIYYIYGVEGYIDDNNNCNFGGGFSQKSLGIYYDKSLKVISITSMLH